MALGWFLDPSGVRRYGHLPEPPAETPPEEPGAPVSLAGSPDPARAVESTPFVVPPDSAWDGCRIVVRCTPAYLAWARALADHLGISLSYALECGLSRLADGHGFAIAPPKRFIARRQFRRSEVITAEPYG